MTVNGQSVEVPAAPYRMEWDEPEFRGAPQIWLRRVLPVATELSANDVWPMSGLKASARR